MTSRKVRRTKSVTLNTNIDNESQRLLLSEWAIVLSIPLLMIGAIRIIAIFYTFALTLILVGGYILIALKDAQKKQPKFHLFATLRYLVAMSALTVVVYLIF